MVPAILNSSKPIAASSAARIELTKGTGYLGNRAINQPNTNHDNRNDTNTETARNIASNPGRSSTPSSFSSRPIGAAPASALSASVAKMATNDHTIAVRSENLVRM